jgi:CspA family cold shock protein
MVHPGMLFGAVRSESGNPVHRYGCQGRRRSPMAEGRIKWYEEKKGYGFIETESDGDFFFHRNSIEDHGHFGLQKTDRVQFEVKTTARGPQAIKIKAM